MDKQDVIDSLVRDQLPLIEVELGVRNNDLANLIAESLDTFIEAWQDILDTVASSGPRLKLHRTDNELCLIGGNVATNLEVYLDDPDSDAPVPTRLSVIVTMEKIGECVWDAQLMDGAVNLMNFTPHPE